MVVNPMCEAFSIDDVPNKRQVASVRPKDFKNHHRAQMPTRLREEKTKDLVVLVMITEHKANGGDARMRVGLCAASGKVAHGRGEGVREKTKSSDSVDRRKNEIRTRCACRVMTKRILATDDVTVSM